MPVEENRLRELMLGDPDGKTAIERKGRLRASGLSVEKFAHAIGVSRTAVYNYMQDRNRPSPATMEKICKVLGIPLSEGVKYCVPREQGRPWKKKPGK